MSSSKSRSASPPNTWIISDPMKISPEKRCGQLCRRILNCDRFCRFLDHAGSNRHLWWARLEHQMALSLHNFLRSILNIIRLLENIRRSSTCWTLLDILAFHNFVQSFVTATALEIFRQMFSQHLQVRITFRAFVHMIQSLCTSWCFIKSIKIQITWSWMETKSRRQS